MENTEKHNIEIGDIENYSSDNGEYSHSTHLDICIKKCIVAGCKELCEGYNETNVDNKGNIKVIYKEDTRKAFIESIKTCKMIMACDFDKKAKKEIKNLLESIKKGQSKFLEMQTTYWENLGYNIQQTLLKRIGIPPAPSCFHKGLDFWNLFIEYELNIYREIFEELLFLSKRLNHFKAEDFEG